jgi:hypothetical protein
VGALALLAGVGFAGSTHATLYTWQFDLEPGQVTPEGSGSNASGQAWLYYETTTDHLRAVVSWRDLEADLSGIHIHGPAQAGFSSRTHLIDIIKDASVLPSGIDLRQQVWEAPTLHIFAQHGGAHGHGGVPTGILPDQVLDAMLAENAYMLVHTDNAIFTGGELRGQLRLISIPEPTTALLMGLGLAGLCWIGTPGGRA